MAVHTRYESLTERALRQHYILIIHNKEHAGISVVVVIRLNGEEGAQKKRRKKIVKFDIRLLKF